MDVRQQLEGKKITLMRIGLLGRGVGDAAFLARSGAEVLVVDSAPQEVMQPSVDALRGYSNITFKFGPYDLEDFRTCDFVLKGAGTPIDSPEITEAHAHGIPVKMSASWFMELSGLPIIGVTGTRGKSTTTHMLHTIMKAAKIPVLLGGNVRGVSTLALLEEATPEHYGLFELDSWQCQGFGDAKQSPHIAVFTTFMADHMNYYRDDMELYLRDKANIFLYQKPGDTLVLGNQCEEAVREAYGSKLSGEVVIAGENDLPEGVNLRIPGIHNRYDAGLARAAARTLSIPDEVISSALGSFAGVPGRLEFIRTVHGVDFYNDSNATTPDATLAALHSFPAAKTVLIMGGSDKGLDMSALLSVVASHCKKVILLLGTGTDRIKNELPYAQAHESLEAAVEAACEVAVEGDVVLLSPAFASFGMFKNEYDRGDQFTAIVQQI